ncbi:MAG: LysR family transcriptional regulator, partial [Klebsiella michiganensis]
MNVTRADMADLVYFFAIARHQSFSKAAVELGVSASTLSHAIKGFEARLGVRLLNRTTKSVSLTAAGESLASTVSEPLASIDVAIEQLNQFRDSPAGHIRLNVAVEAATLLLAPVLPVFAERYPDIELDIVASNRIVDVT